MRFALIFVITASLFACQDARPPTPTKEESERLDDADSMLDDLASNETGNVAP